jgi:hypothetical protein
MFRQARRDDPRRRGPRRSLRGPAEIQQQFDAARAYAPAVAELAETSHRYTAGQAATLAWLVGLAGDPLPTNPQAWPAVSLDSEGAAARGAPGAAEVRRLRGQTRSLLGGTRAAPGPRGPEPTEVLNPAYVMGVAHVCEWALGHTAVAPFRGGG